MNQRLLDTRVGETRVRVSCFGENNMVWIKLGAYTLTMSREEAAVVTGALNEFLSLP